MCGIVGLLVKKPQQRGELGRMMRPMFSCMAERGGDSAGVAVFGAPIDENVRRLALHVPDRSYNWNKFLKAFGNAFSTEGGNDAQIVPQTNHCDLITSVQPARIRAWLAECDPSPHVLSVGRYIDVFKDMGHPDEIADRYDFDKFEGSHCVGHTRMATESEVTPHHAHPFTSGEDFCLVHNGSLSNPYMLRRMLERKGLKFETDNDTEAACRYIEYRLSQGDTLDQAIEHGFSDLDGFYTLLMATPDQLTLVRDAFACKPAVVAETDDYVAISSEFRSMAHLPGIDDANLFEPKPEVIYSWKV